MNEKKTQVKKVALVTGGARRIGAAIVKRLHDKGFDVAIHYHRSEKEACLLKQALNETREKSAEIFCADLASESACQTLIKDFQTFAPHCHLLCNNASMFIKTPLESACMQTTWNALFQVNVRAPWLLSQFFRPIMPPQSTIVNLTDIHGEIPLKDYAIYSQTKAALIMQTRMLAIEFSPHLRVNAISPGAIAWPEGENALSPEIQQKIIEKTPLKRHGLPEYIAEAVWMMAENPFITGQILNVDGGRSLK